MTHRSTRFAAVCSSFTLSAALLGAGMAQAQSGENLSPNRAAAPVPLTLNVVVAPSSGEPVANLPQSAFTVLDNGQPQAIQSFRAVSGKQAASEVLVVVDAVNIRYTQLAYARQQIEDFLKDNGGQLAFPTSLVILTDTKTETTGFTTDGNGLSGVLEQKVIGLRELTRSTGFYGAQERLDISLKAFTEVMARAGEAPGHKIVIWVSPGWPLLSGPGIDLSAKEADGIFAQAVRLSDDLHRANVTLYSVDPLGAQQSVLRTFYYENYLKGLRKPGDAQLGNLGLQVLAVQSGGLALSSSNDVRRLIEKALKDTQAEYEVTLAPETVPADGKAGYHGLEVRVTQPGLKARTDQSFYAQP